VQEHRQHAGSSPQQLRRAVADDHRRVLGHDLLDEALFDPEAISLVNGFGRRRDVAGVGTRDSEGLAEPRPPRRLGRRNLHRRVAEAKIFSRVAKQLAVDAEKAELFSDFSPDVRSAAASLSRQGYGLARSLHRPLLMARHSEAEAQDASGHLTRCPDYKDMENAVR
jgi:hypothetical protein